jgi:hypothetical protein
MANKSPEPKRPWLSRLVLPAARAAPATVVVHLDRSPEMNFDSLVTRLERSLLPVVRKEEARLRQTGKFSDVRVASIRHGDVIHAMGIACRPIWASEELERLGLTATLTGITDLSGRIDVQWSQVFVRSTGSGYLEKETGGFHSKLVAEAAVGRFEKEWLRMVDLFLRVAARGTPSPYLLRRLRGAPADQNGWKAEGEPAASADVGAAPRRGTS